MSEVSLRSGDRRVQRTQRTLRAALVELVLKHGWDAVSVQQVCERADVGRSTFYVHFADKEDLLLSGFEELHSGLAAGTQANQQAFAFAEPLLTHAAANHDLFRAVVGRQSGQQVQWRFRDVVRTLIDTELAQSTLPDAARARTVQFIAGGFVEILMAWLDEPRGAEPKDLAASFQCMALAAIRAVDLGDGVK